MRGHTAATITGTVTDANTSLPIQGALIEAERGNVVRYTDTTDINGNYTLSNVKPSTYDLICSMSGYQTQIVGVKAQNNQTTVVDFALDLNGGTISGTVSDAVTSMHIPGATVNIYQNSQLISTQITNGAGFYSVADLAPGMYIVEAKAATYQTLAESATVMGGMTTTVDIALQSNPGAISGQVTDAATMIPIADVLVEVFSNSVLIGFDNTDASGNYSIPDLAPGDYVVVTTSDNYADQSTGAEVTANTTTIVNFALTADPGTISGKVTDAATTQSIRGASINIYQDQVLIRTLLTDSNGNYTASGLASGDYLVVASANNYQTASSPATVVSNSTTTVNFALNSNPGAISGTITNAVTTNPIPGADVLVFSGSTLIAETVSASNGTYLVPNLAPGSYEVLAKAIGFGSSSATVVVAASATTIANFALNPNPGSVTGNVTSLCGGKSLPGVLVVVKSGSAIVGYSLTNSSGHYVVEELDAGNYTVAAGNANFIISSTSATVLPNTPTTVNFTLTPKALSPLNLRGEAIKDRFLTQTDRIHAIFWTASPGSCVTGYEVLRNGVAIAFVSPAGPLQYLDHNRHSTDVYTVRSINSFGQVSAGVSVQVPPLE